MLVYYNNGFHKYENDRFPITRRAIWEFQCSLSGGLAPTLPEKDSPPVLRKRTLWVFPAGHEHGWIAGGKVERIVFHFTTVPGELTSHVPSRGYYRVALADEDCERIRVLGEEAESFAKRPTKMLFLRTQTLVGELSLIALREIIQPALSTRELASYKTERAVAYYAQHIAEDPRFEEIAAAVHTSPTHLRRLFHKVRGESPHAAFNRLRMETAEKMLRETDYTLDVLAPQLGFSNSAALSRAVKTHFGISPSNLRKETRPLRE